MAGASISNTLRKKPVRRATAKQTEPEPQPEPKRSRGRKVAPTLDPIVIQNTAPEELEPEPEPKPARKVGRPRRQAPEPVADQPTPAEEPTKPTRSTAASRAKAAEMQAAKQRDASVVSGPEPTKHTRGTATKAQPLSPKKITQISRTQTRNAKSLNVKPTVAKMAPKARGTRTRTISDENADVPKLSHVEQEEEEVIIISSTPVKSISPSKRVVTSERKAESEGTMSSGPTTPSDSPAPTFEHMADEHEYRLRNSVMSAHECDDEDEDGENLDQSEDELCGPKTPLKRSRPGPDARFHASLQRSIRRAQMSTPMEKPRNLTTRSRRLVTPQTQKPYCKPSVPASQARAMTVARGGDRAFVFQDLRAFPSVDTIRIIITNTASGRSYCRRADRDIRRRTCGAK